MPVVSLFVSTLKERRHTFPRNCGCLFKNGCSVDCSKKEILTDMPWRYEIARVQIDILNKTRLLKHFL